MSPQVDTPTGWSESAGVLVRVFVGGCVKRGDGSSFRRQAHAHNYRSDPHFGWICVRSPKRLKTPSGKPTTVMFHEFAHILTPNAGHGMRWRAQISELGYPAEAKRYARRQPKTSA